MQIRGAVIGSVATVAVIAGGVLAIASANADNAVPASTPSATVTTTVATPTPLPTVTPTPTPSPTPEAVVTATPTSTPTVAPTTKAPTAPLVQGTAPPADSGTVVVQPGTVMPPHPPGTFYVPPDN